MLIIDQKNQDFEFTFDSGEHIGEGYIGSIKFCPSPTCNCKAGTITLKNNFAHEEGSRDISPQYSFAIDIDLKKVSNRDDMSISDKNVAKSFIKNLSSDEWEKLYLNYLWFKTYVTETAETNEIKAVFPDELISDGATVHYNDILPFGERIYVTIGSEEYMVTEQYCVQPHCKCTDVFLAFCALTKGGVRLKRTKEDIAIECDYKKGSWKLYQNYKKADNLNTFPDICMLTLKEKRGDLFSFFEKRHNKLKALYKQYLKDNKPDLAMPVSEKISRNDRCPCGSGKKYKKCCMNK